MSRNQNLYHILSQRFPADGEQPFIIDQLSYAELEASSARMANYLLSLDLNSGDRVAVQVNKSAQVLVVYLACLRAGLIYLPLNTAYTQAELAYFFQDAGPGLIVADQASVKTLAQQQGARFETMAGLLAHSATAPAQFATVHSSADDLAAILYTSGTTGRPKGAMLSHSNLAANALMLHDYWGWDQQDVLLHALPIFHVHGLFVACHCVLAAGASMIFLPSFKVEQVIEQLPRATVMMGVPTFYTRLLASEDFSAQPCHAMRLFISGSAPLLASTHQLFEQRTGHKILERYGMSETSMLISNPLHGERRAGTVGFALPGVDARIVDTNNKAVSEGVIGSIQVKGPNVFQGYWQMLEKTAEEFTDDGFFITGDQGLISEDGYISIVGRAKDMVISGGYNVYPKEVELVIDAIEGVKESAVFGVADADFGEAVSVAVVLDHTVALSPEQIAAEARETLAAYKVPKLVHFLDELPRNTMGKVQKNVLRQQFAS
ncbi:malonate--CoA ligase [Oceanicoccus sagamiensis]|uniref:Malonyl-CoA synthase n=1 Tax=Oceanicoccus sagamiensis TaxID=716816 RepID=A0A1X9ND92_9GAMM|nr:malonyl-CoA synthase [Oceanicoccus sagamiensis]ARN76000.1 malonyl-CoA synthase [Oceanicoccus sagamiensis]